MSFLTFGMETNKQYEKDDEKYDANNENKDDDGTLWNLSNLNEGKVVCSSRSLFVGCQQSIVER